MPQITTIGRARVEQAIGAPVVQPWVKDVADDYLKQLIETDPQAYREISQRLLDLGREAVYTSGTTLGMDDLRPVIDTRPHFKALARQQALIQADRTLTPQQKKQATQAAMVKTQKAIVDATYEEALARGNPLAEQVRAKARGNKNQLTAILSTPGIYEDARGDITPMFIENSFSHGLTPREYWSSTPGARKSVIATKFCLWDQTEVLSKNYQPVRLCDLQIGDEIWSVDETNRMVLTTITAICDTGLKPCRNWTFGEGKRDRSVIATDQHGIRLQYRRRGCGTTKQVDAPLVTATVGRKAAVLPTPFPGGVHEPLAFAIGALLGDGSLTQHNTNIFGVDSVFWQFLDNQLREHNLRLTGETVTESGCTRYTISELVPSANIGGGVKTPFRAKLAELGMLGVGAPEKRIPQQVWTWDISSICALIAGMLSTDGSATHVVGAYSREYPVLSYASSSRELVADLRDLMQRRLFLNTSAVDTRPEKGNVSKFGDRTGVRNHDMHSVLISDLLSQQFLLNNMPTGCSAKLVAWADRVRAPRRRRPNFRARFSHAEQLGVLPTRDIEVAHPSHMFVLANGLIVSNSTRDAGYLGKQINSAIADVQVVEEECGATAGVGLPVAVDDTDNLGAMLAQEIAGFKPGTLITPEVQAALQSKVKEGDILVRSPVTCRSQQGVCAHCAGVRESGRFAKVGERIGVNAGAALAERIAQSSLNTKHSGGQGGQKGDASFQGFSYVDQFMQIPVSFSDAATLAKQAGTVQDIKEAPQGGHYITVGDEQHYVPADLEIRTAVGDKVYAGDALSGGLVNPREVVGYKGLGEGRRYFTSRLMQMLKDSGYSASRRNVEVLARGLVNHVVNEDMEDTGGALPGDVLEYSGWASGYAPRRDAAVLSPDRAIGKYLEAPTLHYSIGTEITPAVAKQLKHFKQSQVMVHEKPPGVRPHMMALREIPQQQPDWMAQLGSNYLKKNLLQNAQRGAVSNTLGRHPLPRVAAGTLTDPRVKDYHGSPNLMDTHRKVRYDDPNKGVDDDDDDKVSESIARSGEERTDGPDDGRYGGFFTSARRA